MIFSPDCSFCDALSLLVFEAEASIQYNPCNFEIFINFWTSFLRLILWLCLLWSPLNTQNQSVWQKFDLGLCLQRLLSSWLLSSSWREDKYFSWCPDDWNVSSVIVSMFQCSFSEYPSLWKNFMSYTSRNLIISEAVSLLLFLKIFFKNYLLFCM